ncbi:MAG: LysE family transporter [Methyloceanibacter sp.]|uniref:LysE family translocator n=1 Tax=Methyloceanibacter sp. TaxID=1965321 RepID=UPI001D4F845E|nr:LysE family transporter [Methyloceanibacter sp.]MCB1442982.1 LysE family transporter [Methyloceanibacter sp.]MCC0058745.1 LysE family transporter [Hyphomicrobiaceae bacterium]
MLSGIQLVLAGLGIGLLMAAPIGPVNVLVIQRAVAKGFWGGLAAGIGAVLGDGVLAAVGAFSVAAISDVMLAHGDTIQVVGGALLVAFGLALLLRKPVMTTPPHERSHLLEHMGIIPQTFILTVTNPGAVLGMAAMIGGLGSLIGGLNTNLEALILVVSVMGGSLLWWLGLSELIATVRHKLTDGRLKLINRIAGIVLFGFGIGLIVESALRYFSQG